MTESEIKIQNTPEFIKRCYNASVCPKEAFLGYVKHINLDGIDTEAAKRIKSLRVFNEPRLFSVYTMLKAKDLAETLRASDVPMDWFAFSVDSYIHAMGNLQTTQLLRDFAEWQSSEKFSVEDWYDYFIKDAIKRLVVFYD